MSEELKACNIPVVTAQIARFFVSNQRRMCDAEAISESLGDGTQLHPPVLVEEALQELEDMGVVSVTKEIETPEEHHVRVYALENYMLAQAVVAESDEISLDV